MKNVTIQLPQNYTIIAILPMYLLIVKKLLIHYFSTKDVYLSLILSKYEKFECQQIEQLNTQSLKQKQRVHIDQIPLKRFATPSETAKAICFLASPNANYINGINLPVDGGRLQTL